MLPCGGRADPASRRAHQEAQLHQEGLVDVLDGHRVLAGSRREGIQTHRAAAELVHHAGEHLAVGAVEAQLIHALHGDGLSGDLQRDLPGSLDLRVVPDPLEHAIGDAGRAA